MTGFEKLKGFTGVAGAFNIFNSETLRGVVKAAIGEQKPVYIQTSASTVKWYGAKELADMIWNAVPEEHRHLVLLHLDHCLDDDLIETCVLNGWDSVMIDASGFPLDENIRRTRNVVEVAHRNDVIVEGEIGLVGGAEDGFESYAGEETTVDSDDAVRFIKETGLDLAAIGVGTKHGFYEDGDCDVNVGLLTEVRELCPGVPLVLHGGSGIPNDQVSASVAAGVRKINVSTEIKTAWITALTGHFEGEGTYGVLKGVIAAEVAVEALCREKIRLFHSFFE